MKPELEALIPDKLTKREERWVAIYREIDAIGLAEATKIPRLKRWLHRQVREHKRHEAYAKLAAAIDSYQLEMVSPELIAAEERAAELTGGNCAGANQTDAPPDEAVAGGNGTKTKVEN